MKPEWRSRMRNIFGLVLFLLFSAPSLRAQITLQLEDFATLPLTGSFSSTGNAGSLARVNFMRVEPGPQQRIFVNDLNGPLYILNKDAKTFVPYLNLNGSGSEGGLFHKFTFAAG